MTRFQSSMGYSQDGMVGPAMPAQATMMSTPPMALRDAATARSTAWGSVTSSATVDTLPFAASAFLAASSNASSMSHRHHGRPESSSRSATA